MKKIKLYSMLLFIFILSTASDCGSTEEAQDNENMSKVGQVLMGEHELIEFTTKDERGKIIPAGYFIVTADPEHSSLNDRLISFKWKLEDGSTITSELRYGQIRTNTEEFNVTPYIKFNWNASDYERTIEYIMTEYVNYMVIYCSEEDLPVDIKL